MNQFEKDLTMGTHGTASAGSNLAPGTYEPNRLSISVPQSDEPIGRPRLVVLGVGGAGGNAVNNMIQANLEGVDFVVANTDAQALRENLAPTKIQLGGALTEGLGAGADPETGRAAAEESIDQILAALEGAHMVFLTAGMGGGTGTGAAPEIAKELKECGILTVGIVTKPFDFEGLNRGRIADAGIEELETCLDTLIVIPNQHLFRIASEKALFSDAMKMADEVLYNGVRAISDLITGSGTWNLDFADVRTLMTGMGKAMMGTGEAEGENRALRAAEIAISNPLLEDMDLSTASGMLINIAAGDDLTFYEVEAAASRVKAEIPVDASIIVGQCTNHSLNGRLRVSVVATGLMQHGSTKAESLATHEADNATEQPMWAPQAEQSHAGQPLAMTPQTNQGSREIHDQVAHEQPQAPAHYGEPGMAFGQATSTGFLANTASGRADVRHPDSTHSAPAVSEAPVAPNTAHRPGRPILTPSMPRHRDAQAASELAMNNRESILAAPYAGHASAPQGQELATAEAQPHIPQPTMQPHSLSSTAPTGSAPSSSSMTAYEKALADAKRDAELAQRAALEAYEREQAALQAQAQAEARTLQDESQYQRAQPAQASGPQLSFAENQPAPRPRMRQEAVPSAAMSALGQAEEAEGLLGRMKNMVSKAATRTPSRPLGAEGQGLSSGTSQAPNQGANRGPNGGSFDGPGGPGGPGGGGGHHATLPSLDEWADSAQATTSPVQVFQSGTASPDENLERAENLAKSTEHRIRTVTNQAVVDDADDDLLMDIPAFLRRQYN